ncbi:MAG TPA: ABC transporter ATP-binding protein [Acidimicrobiales bacterium]|nr:ABC transporter ATP-binding protein [Acidimicrobiales bacterium]
MAWGGGGGGMGFGGGGPAGNPGGGLPFAGIPPELQSRVDTLLETEPEHPEQEPVEFSHAEFDRRPFTLRRFLGGHRLALVGAFALVVIETVAMQAGPLLTQIGIDRGIQEGSTTTLVVVSVLYFAAVALNAMSSAARIAWTGRVGETLMFQLRVRIFSHLQRLSVPFFTKEKAGRLMTRMTSDLESLTALFQDGLVQMVVQGLTIIVVTTILFTMNATLAAITLVVVVPGMAALTWWFRGASLRTYGLVRDRIADVLAHLQENLSGIRIVTAHNRQRHNTIEHRNIAGDYRSANDATARVGAIYGPSVEAIGIAGQAFILLVGGRMVLDGDLMIGQLAAFVLYLTAFFAPIQQMVQLYDTYQKGQASVAKLQELLATEPSVAEAPDAAELPPILGEIRFEDVTFAYEPGRPVLRDVDLTIAAGETFALVGATGAGKSTMAKLVTRFHDPEQGRVLIDGHDLRRLTLTSLRRQLGVVPQEAFLFGGSMRDNIAFARPAATEAEVLEACRAVGIDDLVDRLPQGIDTPVHERGVALSSGERQLLALARAFLARPRVLVLDEATSNLDLRSESKIEHALDVLLEGRTAIVIAHRLATAMRADRIGVVDDGRIVELGSHDELVAAGGRYAAMYATWESHAGVA